jgi:hypothetical protein
VGRDLVRLGRVMTTLLDFVEVLIDEIARRIRAMARIGALRLRLAECLSTFLAGGKLPDPVRIVCATRGNIIVGSKKNRRPPIVVRLIRREREMYRQAIWYPSSCKSCLSGPLASDRYFVHRYRRRRLVLVNAHDITADQYSLTFLR